MIVRFALLPLGLIMVTGATFAAEPTWQGAISISGVPKYKDSFAHFDYVNPMAPKGGTAHLSSMSAFDNLNPFMDKGVDADGLGLVFDTLLTPSLDEADIAASYGLLAEAIQVPEDKSWVKFRLRHAAKWQDGQPVTADDVVWSFNQLIKVNVSKANYYSHVSKAEVSGPDEVTFSFDLKNNQELPLIVGEFPVLPRHWWEAKTADGKPRNVSETTLEPVMGSGPYKITTVSPGHQITYSRNPNYWAAQLPVRIGQNNFDTLIYDVYRDRTVEFEAFKAGQIDYWLENEAKRWATGYDIQPVKDGKIQKEMLARNSTVGHMVGFLPNLRRAQFQDQRVRRALNLCFDFEELNRTTFFGQYQRIDSYFFGTDLKATDLPGADEVAVLNSVKDLIPASVFTAPYQNPVGGDPAKVRENLKAAVALFTQAGYAVKDGKMTGPDGKPFTFEILLNGPIIERIAIPYVQWLGRIGITATVRTVDASQFVQRINNRDFDVVYYGWDQSLSPGNELIDYWSSKAADSAESQNFGGIKDAGVDALIGKILAAKDRASLVTSVKALDRVMLAHDYMVPTYTILKDRIAYWDKLTHMDPLPKYALGFPTVWWAK